MTLLDKILFIGLVTAPGGTFIWIVAHVWLRWL